MEGEENPIQPDQQPPVEDNTEAVDATNVDGGDEAVVETNENGEPVEGESPEDGDAPLEEGAETQDLPAYAKVDYSKDQSKNFSNILTCLGITWMLKTLMELDEFQISKVSNEKMHKFFDFLENPEYLKFFVWLNQESEVEYSFDSAPKFFGKFKFCASYLHLELNITAEQYQICYFIKRSGKE